MASGVVGGTIAVDSVDLDGYVLEDHVNGYVIELHLDGYVLDDDVG